MNWQLLDIKQETNHKYLNFFTFIYDVDGKKYEYFLASRHSKEDLYALHKSSKPDGVLISCYFINEKGETSFLVTSQFRPALNKVVTSIPAGLIDEDDDLFSAAIREAKEEAGVDITDLELICPPSPTSSGLSDEINAVVLARIVSQNQNHLEEFEDISSSLVSRSELIKMLNDEQYFFALNVRLIFNYLLLRFPK